MKKYLMKLLASCMAFAILVGCTKVEVENPQVEDMPCLLYIDAYSLHEMAMLHLTGMGGEALEIGSIEFEITAGNTVEGIMKDSDYEFVDVVCEYDTFEGWLQYEVFIETDENGFSTFTYALMDKQLLSTEEMLSKVMDGDKNISFTAKWAGMEMEDYYLEEEFAEDVSGYTCVMAIAANQGIVSVMDTAGECYNQAEAIIFGLNEDECLNESFADNAYFVEVTKEGAAVKDWTVYQADALDIFYEKPTGGGYWFGLDDAGTETWITMTNETLVSENMSTEEVYRLKPNEGVYFVIANWES